MWSQIAFAFCLLVLSAALIWHHLKSRRETESEDLEDSDRDFFRRQFRRRMLVSSLIGVVGAAIFAGIWIGQPLALLVLWGAIVLVVCGIGMLGVVDWMALRVYYQRMKRRHTVEHKALRDELKRILKIQGNGKDE